MKVKSAIYHCQTVALVIYLLMLRNWLLFQIYV